MKVCVLTLGCKVNQYESGAIARRLKELGHEVFETMTDAELYIVNTCAVTGEAERKSRQIAKRCRNRSPKAKVVVCGCSAQREAEQYSFADLVTGTSRKGSIVDELEKSGAIVRQFPTAFEEDFLFSETERVRAYVKVQDGCNNFCAYCIVPYLRGRSRSRSIPGVLAELERHAGSVSEFVLTGIDLSDYGAGLGLNLADLIAALQGVDARIRLGSLEVRVVDERLLEALAGLKRFCPHFHLSLQSGSDGVLARMNRHYTAEQYYEKVTLIRGWFQGAGITTDVIAGFPGESDAEHAETCAFVKKAAFSDIHVFGYSPRAGTAAAKLAPLDARVVKRRTEELLRIKAELKAAFFARECGSIRQMLPEEERDGYLSGYTENYLRVYLPGEGDAEINRTVRVRVGRPFRDGVLASVEP